MIEGCCDAWVRGSGVLWDLVVIGAGPAGSAAALAALRARPEATVLLLDRSRFPRDKSCGDGIAPQALDELARLGAADILADRAPVHRLSLRSPAGTEAATSMARPGYVVPRLVFDARLVAAAVGRGAVLEQRVVRQVEVAADRVVVDGCIAARAVIGADGANGVVRRQLALHHPGLPARQPPGALALAVRGYAAAPPGEPEQRIVMDARGWPAYAWSFGAGDGTANVGYGMLLPRLTAVRTGSGRSGRAELHERLAELLPEVRATGPVTGLVTHHLPLSSNRPRQPPGRILLAGDAASLINPLSGEGIFYALLSGRLAGLTAVSDEGVAASSYRPGSPDDPGSRYRHALRGALGRHLRHTRLLDALTRRPTVLEAGVGAAARSPAAFHSLVELSLGRGLISRPLLTALAQGVADERWRSSEGRR